MLRRKQGCCFSQELVVHFQFSDFLAQPGKFGPFINFQLPCGKLTAAFTFSFHPATQKSWIHIQFAGDCRG